MRAFRAVSLRCALFQSTQSCEWPPPAICVGSSMMSVFDEATEAAQRGVGHRLLTLRFEDGESAYGAYKRLADDGDDDPSLDWFLQAGHPDKDAFQAARRILSMKIAPRCTHFQQIVVGMTFPVARGTVKPLQK